MNIKQLVAIGCSVGLWLAAAQSALAVTYTVNSTLDLPDGDTGDGVCATAPPGPPVCTLRAAVMQANARPGPDTISVPAGTYLLTRVGYEAAALLGDLDIIDDLTIVSGGGTVIIDANGAVTADRAFEVLTGTLTLHGVTIQHGNSPGAGGAINAPGNLTLIDVTIQNNTAAEGGGIYASGAATIQLSSTTIRNNTSQGTGGGIEVFGSGLFLPDINIADSLIENNRAHDAGGGLHVHAATTSIQNSTLRNNTADAIGGGVYYLGNVSGLQLDMANTLIISNSAGVSSGGLRLFGNTNLSNSQIISNAAPSAGGLEVSDGLHTWNDVTISANTASSCAGLNAGTGSLNLNHGWIENNIAQTQGGGLCVFGGTLHITDSNVLNNRATQGGGVWVYGNNQFFAARSAIDQNSATRGGGVYALGQAFIEDSTLSGNTATRDGGGIYADGGSTVRLNSATLVYNRARLAYPSSGAGAGIYISATAVVSAANTLISTNANSALVTTYSDCFGTLRSEAYNFIGSNAGCTITGDTTGNHVGGDFPNNINPMIEPLTWLTGLTPGHLPLAGSPLINAGRPSGCQAALGGILSVDQIGHNRSLAGRCDIGAIEYFAIRRVYLPSTRK